MATMKQIAELAGVSRGTVDRVLHNRGIVNKETAEKIERIAQSLQYTPNKAARSLAARKRNLKLTYILFEPEKNEFFQQVEESIQKKADELGEYGVTVEILHSDFKNRHHVCDLLDEALRADTSGIAITGFNSETIAAKLREISAGGIPIITSNTDIANCGRLAFVGSNSYRAGDTAAGLTRLMNSSRAAKVGVILGSPEVLCHTERYAGFSDNLKAHSADAEIISVVKNDDDDFESFSVTRELLVSHPEINTLYLAGAGVYGACRAIERLEPSSRPLVICNDCTGKTREMLEKGIISATIGQQPEIQGARPLELLFDYLAMNVMPEKEYYYTDIDIVIRENLQ